MEKQNLLQFRIEAIKQETANAKTYSLNLLNGEELRFKPGQFLTFIINTDHHQVRRSYSILSLPGEPLKITVKKVENGLISRYILQNWREGEIIYSLPPAGWFSLTAQQQLKRDVFCFAAGSGIVPILAQIRYLLKNEPQSMVHLIYSTNSEADTLFLKELEELADTNSSFQLIFKFSNPEQRLKEQGRLSNITTEILIESILRYEQKDAIFLLCGPFAYMRMLTFTIGSMHFRKQNILKENFIPEIMRSGQALHKVFAEQRIVLKWDGQVHYLQVNSGQTILDAAIEGGLQLPYSCKGGVCGNCAAKCKSGKIYMSVNEVLSDSDLQQGWILTCTGYPEEGNVVIKIL